MAQFSASLIPGLNSYIVLNDPEASAAAKVFAVGTDVLAVVGVGSVIKAAKTGSAVLRGGTAGVEVAQGAEKALIKGGTYLLRNRETAVVMRTGRTVDFARRATEHLRDPVLREFEFEAMQYTSNYAEQRGLEQYCTTYTPRR